MTTTIYHNPRCSKSRQTLALIEDKGVTPKVVEYLDTPPSAAELKRLLKMLGMEPTEIIRFKEAIAKELGISKKDERSENEWVKLMVANAKLIERPIVVVGDKAVMGRPPENVLSII